MVRQPADITDLIQRARAEEPGAIEQLLDSYRNYLSLLARTSIGASLRGKADVSDVVQETMLKAFRRFGQFAGNSEPEIAAWLRQILAHNLIDLARKYHTAEARRITRERSIEDLLNRSSHMMGDFLASSGTSPSQSASRRELSVVLADALADLSDEYREVIVMRNLEELEWDAIADKMNRSVGAVRMLWARALKKLRPLIERRL